jgi:enoyl-CoA hydratase/carnithine racemase
MVAYAEQVRLLGQYYQEWDTSDNVHCILLRGAGPKVQQTPWHWVK